VHSIFIFIIIICIYYRSNIVLSLYKILENTSKYSQNIEKKTKQDETEKI